MRILIRGLFILMTALTPLTGWAQEGHTHPHDDSLLDREIKISKTGEINLPEAMKLNDVELKKGRYIVQHRTEVDVHWFTFTPKTGKAPEPAKAVESRARMLPLRGKVKESIVLAVARDDNYRFARIQLAGEMVEYVF